MSSGHEKLVKENRCWGYRRISQIWPRNSKFSFKPCRRQAKQTLKSIPPQNSKLWQPPCGNYDNFGNHPDAADVKIQLKSQDYLIQIQYFCNFSFVSLSIHPPSRQGAERITQGQGRWSRPLKTALERRDWTEKFQFRASRTEAGTKELLTEWIRMIIYLFTGPASLWPTVAPPKIIQGRGCLEHQKQSATVTHCRSFLLLRKSFHL